jgi:hypothetical protein
MNRRDFLKLSMYAGCSCLIPALPRPGAAAPLDDVLFDASVYAGNQPRTIMIFLYGGASELAGNFTNYDTFKELSQNSYEDYFGSSNLQATTNGFWNAAGGNLMEEMLAGDDLNVFRTCFSQVRWDNDNRSHGSCVNQNQRGRFSEDSAGIFANLGRILLRNGILDDNSIMPFISMEGESGFYARGDMPMTPVLEPVTLNENLDNPFSRNWERDYSDTMNQLAQDRNTKLNLSAKITDAFAKRSAMEQFINDIDDIPDPELGVNSNGESLNYDDNSFADKLKTAIKILDFNDDTQVVSLGTSGLGGWDDHSDADNYLRRMNELFRALRSAMAHIHQTGKQGRFNIMVMSDFGRGLNLNTANGWDHGNLQSLYILGGTNYFNTPGVVGTTMVDAGGSVNRLYLRPADANWFEPLSVAATIYSIYGVTNPEVLTDGNPRIAALFN